MNMYCVTMLLRSNATFGMFKTTDKQELCVLIKQCFFDKKKLDPENLILEEKLSIVNNSQRFD